MTPPDDLTPETLRDFDFSIPGDPALAEALRLWLYRHASAWAADCKRIEALWANCRIIYYPPLRPPDFAPSYPIEHNALAGRMGRSDIEAALCSEDER